MLGPASKPVPPSPEVVTPNWISHSDKERAPRTLRWLGSTLRNSRPDPKESTQAPHPSPHGRLPGVRIIRPPPCRLVLEGVRRKPHPRQATRVLGVSALPTPCFRMGHRVEWSIHIFGALTQALCTLGISQPSVLRLPEQPHARQPCTRPSISGSPKATSSW